NQENPAETLTFSSLTAEVELKGCTPIQGIGAVHTYMKRYLYMNALEIVENDMLDAQAGNIREDNLKVNIESIQTVNDLNKAYKWLVENPSKDTSWRLKLKEKADQLNVIFNTDSKMFEPDSIPQFERPQLNGAIAH
ncbi:MAG: ERF family protein, partial [Holosporaceae bacterium]|nr:ERF family protein [Holosporaceae bacterium]